MRVLKKEDNSERIIMVQHLNGLIYVGRMPVKEVFDKDNPYIVFDAEKTIILSTEEDEKTGELVQTPRLLGASTHMKDFELLAKEKILSISVLKESSKVADVYSQMTGTLVRPTLNLVKN